MAALPLKFDGAVLAALTVSGAALAQSYYDDRQRPFVATWLLQASQIAGQPDPGAHAAKV
jgi:hypothetical protein